MSHGQLALPVSETPRFWAVGTTFLNTMFAFDGVSDWKGQGKKKKSGDETGINKLARGQGQGKKAQTWNGGNRHENSVLPTNSSSPPLESQG